MRLRPGFRGVRAALVAMALILALAFGSATGASAQASGTVYGLTPANELVTFDAAAPSQITSTVVVSGLASGEALLGIDFRPATGELYALGSGSNIYTIDPASGAASAVGTTSPAIEGSAFGFDFNPSADAIRIVSDAGQNLRVSPDDAETTVDGNLAYAEDDENAGADPGMVGAAYTNNLPDVEDTMLFDIDPNLDTLVQQDANPGVLSAIGPLGVDTSEVVGFDVTTAGGTDEAYATLSADGVSSVLYSVDLSSGAATEIGAVGATISGFAIPTDAGMAMGQQDMAQQAAPATIPDTGGVSSSAVAVAAGAAIAGLGVSLTLVSRRRFEA